MNYPEDFINKVICGDCLEVMPFIPDKAIDMILCDLPYEITDCKWDILIPLDKLWKQYKRIIKDNGAIVLTASQPFTSMLIMSNLEMFKYCWYWQKERGTGFQFSKYQPLKVIEEIVIFGNSPTSWTKKQNSLNYYPIKEKLYKPYKHILPRKKIEILRTGIKTCETGKSIYHIYTHKFPNNILKFARDYKKIHPTQKPVALFEYLIKTYTNEGDLVLDNCVGSGTTGVACKNLGRKFILIEKEEKYCEIARNGLKAIPELLFK